MLIHRALLSLAETFTELQPTLMSHCLACLPSSATSERPDSSPVCRSLPSSPLLPLSFTSIFYHSSKSRASHEQNGVKDSTLSGEIIMDPVLVLPCLPTTSQANHGPRPLQLLFQLTVFLVMGLFGPFKVHSPSTVFPPSHSGPLLALNEFLLDNNGAD